ncbi:unnamed protein product [Coregonus sp. 'balchen']|nr:unnamed protein product [Coregonus sp. 'balchen']
MAPELCAVALEDGQKEVRVPPLNVETSLDTWAFRVVIFCILTIYFPWERCVASHDFYQEFADWCHAPTVEEVPPLWKRFTPAVMEMFSRLLELDASKSCTVGKVRSYVEKDWVTPMLVVSNGQQPENARPVSPAPPLVCVGVVLSTRR